MSTESKSIISVDNAGLLRPENIEDAFRLAKCYVISGVLPERYKTPEMVLTAMQFALELGLKPLTALRQIAVVKGTPCVFGDLPLSMVYASGRLEWIKEVWLDKNMNEISLANKNLREPAYAAICTVKRKGDQELTETYFTMDDAQAAGLTSSPTWKSYTRRMLRYRARSQALKDKFPDAINGIAIAEYDLNTIEEEIVNVTPSKQPAQAVADLVAEVFPDTPVDTGKKPSLADRLKKKNAEAEIIEALT